MSEVDVVAVGSFAIRMINAVLWTVICFKILQHDRPVPRLVRQLITTVIFGGMWVLAFGGLTQFGVVPGDIARFVYTIFTAYAGIVALALVSDEIADRKES